MDFIIAGLAACCACVFTNPLEVLKTRIQLQGELQKKGQHIVHYKSMFYSAATIIKNEGLLGLQKGLFPALLVQFIVNGIRLGTYQAADTKNYTRDEDGNLVFYKTVFISGLGGVVGQFVASPFYMIKVHLMSESIDTIAVGHQHRHRSTIRAFTRIFKKHGIRGLYRGATASIPRGFAAATSQLTSYTYSKEMLNNYEFDDIAGVPAVYTNLLAASMISGISIALVTTPFDLVLTRIYNQGVDSKGRGLLYDSYWDCFKKIYRTEGLHGFTKGFMINYVKIGRHNVLCLLFWNMFKIMYSSGKLGHYFSL